MVGNNASAQTDPLLASILKIVSPVEVSNLIREQGIAYNKGILNKPENTLKYTTPYKQALNLGIFSTDLGYATINDQNMDALSYLTQVRSTATALKVEKYINTGKIMSLAANKNDLNKLLDETATTFENISDHLEKQQKANQAALMLTGGWIEMLYITCEVAKGKPNEELNDRIISQKFILDQIIDVLKPYSKDADTKKLSDQLGELKAIFDVYKIEAKESTSVTEVQKGKDGQDVLVTVSKGGSNDIKLSPDEVNKIANKVKEIRKAIVD
ncbi:MAG: hypothetical protein EAZ95_07100 [Bacteroidetes bacterium]|nr:MAG: hypothetical protein EAZ95_07100 [Bacteroidota bacterium]